MSLHLVRIGLKPERLLQFAYRRGLTQEDDGLGYALHLWLVNLFHRHAPKPFRYFDRRGELLAYSGVPAAELQEQAQAFAPPDAWAVLDGEAILSKPMPELWRPGRKLQVEVLACPVSRQDDEEKDVYLRALDRLGEQAPSRGEVYRQWFLRQWQGSVEFEALELAGLSARRRFLRKGKHGPSSVERPQALFRGQVVIQDGEAFAKLLARGIGRHRAFGFGMILVGPPS